ncbi:hypothetical protein ASF62_05205 [Leifsonia sp. Leaf325]|nr:hypothetical protein [Leifsonia sp. Leaf325]KQQ95874.1 hypothetical protein ASF62_05205 [Leifsonia sp. Leaf325]
MITIPRGLIVALAAVFSAYHVVLAITSLGVPDSPVAPIIAICLYVLATVFSLWPSRPGRMPLWVAAFDLAASIAMPLLVCSTLDATADNGYATWYVAAIGTLMTITAVRGRLVVAWVGVGFLVLQTLVWAGPAALGFIGVIGSVVWVGVAHFGARALSRASREARSYSLAEREAADWQAAQDAHLHERQVRLATTDRMAAPMLRRIVETDGDLSDAERLECRQLEAAIRDEIRGRMLLDDGVRAAVRDARQRGASVTLLDEGGIDDLDDDDRRRTLTTLRDAIVGTAADRIIVRTVSDDEVAVTVVGLRGGDQRTAALGDGGSSVAVDDDDDDDGEEVDLWLEIPR